MFSVSFIVILHDALPNQSSTGLNERKFPFVAHTTSELFNVSTMNVRSSSAVSLSPAFEDRLKLEFVPESSSTVGIMNVSVQ